MIRPYLPLAVLASAAAVFACSAAHARVITSHDRAVIEQVNRLWNKTGYDVSHSDCNWYANNKAFDLLKQGFTTADLAISAVADERGQPHTVLEVIGTDEHGRPVDMVLDNHYIWTVPRAALEQAPIGYHWLASLTGPRP